MNNTQSWHLLKEKNSQKNVKLNMECIVTYILQI